LLIEYDSFSYSFLRFTVSSKAFFSSQHNSGLLYFGKIKDMGGVSFLFLICIVSTILQQISGFVPVTYIKSFQKQNLPLTSALYSRVDSDEAVEGPLQKLIDLGSSITSSKPYSALETVILLGVLAAVDGGFSGDWSRLGLITTDLETTIRSTITRLFY
jgi:hypothetical protein